MIVLLQIQGPKTPDELRGFLAGSLAVEFHTTNCAVAYSFSCRI